MKRTVTYPRAQVRVLVRAVRQLAEQLKRPVSAKDLKKHFNEHPDDQPGLLQRGGQQLIKASRPVSKDRLYRIGTIGNLAYYAADSDQFWRTMFAQHEADLAIERALKEDFPALMAALLRRSQEGLARNALAGWSLEMEGHLKLASESFSAGIMRDVLHFAVPQDLSPWAGISPGDFVTKSEAVAVLTAELALRAPFKLETGNNWNRHLAGWRWPQSVLFRKPIDEPVYSRRQLAVLAKSLWPERDEDGDLARAELLALRYGLPHPK